MRVLLQAWGVTDADVDRAVDEAGLPPSRTDWEFEVERLTSGCCPLDMRDPKALAEGAGYGWAYVAYPARDRVS